MHEITVREDGRAEAAYALTPAWHGLGAVLPEPMTSQDALYAAGLDWRVAKRPVGVIRPSDGTYQPLEDVWALVREDNDQPLNVVRSRYKVIQNEEAFACLDKLVDDGELRYEAAMSLRGGRFVVLLARMPEKQLEVTDGDRVDPYVLLMLRHGDGSLRLGPTAVRVVCMNTYRMALAADRRNRILRISHQGDVERQLTQAVRALKVSYDCFRQHVETMRQFAKIRLTDEQLREFARKLYPDVDEKTHPRKAKAVAAARDGLRTLYYEDPRQQLAGVSGTAWAAICAAIQQVDHRRYRGVSTAARTEARFNTTQLGVGAAFKRHAIETMADICAVSVPVEAL